MTNVVNLEDYRKEKKPPLPPPIMAFEPGGYYIYPELGIMAHCLFITDKAITYGNEPMYVLEDQFGNLHGAIMADDTCEGWHELEEHVFISTYKTLKSKPEPDPPTPRAG